MQSSDLIILTISIVGLILIGVGVYFFVYISDDEKNLDKTKGDNETVKKVRRRRVNPEVVNVDDPRQQIRDNDVQNQDDIHDDNEDGEDDVDENTPSWTRKEYLKMEKKKAKAEEKALEAMSSDEYNKYMDQKDEEKRLKKRERRKKI